MKKTTFVSLLLLSAVIAAPASANYFSNTTLLINRNIGSAANPSAQDIREQRVPQVREEITASNLPKGPTKTAGNNSDYSTSTTNVTTNLRRADY
jgi:hypothetical protein